jgi:hypothetical protein
MKLPSLRYFATLIPFVIIGISSVYAAIPARENLIIELTHSGGILSDTSGNNRLIRSYGDVSSSTASGTSLSTLQFAGSGQVNSTLSWYAGSASPFTLSFWVKAPIASRSNLINDCPSYGSGARFYTGANLVSPPGYNYGVTYTLSQLGFPEGCYRYGGTAYSNPAYTGSYTHYYSWLYFIQTGTGRTLHSEPLTQTLMSFRKGTTFLATDLHLSLTPDYKCKIEGVGEFDCNDLKDGGWHMITIRKNYYQTLEALIDTKQIVYWRNSLVTTSRNLYLGQEGTGSGGLARYKGEMAGIRVYNTDLTEAQLFDLYDENSSQVMAGNPAIPMISITQPNISQASSKKISATTSTGVLMQAQTNGEICNDTLTFEEYSDLIFSSIQDNNTRLCYRAVNGAFKTFKLSDQIKGIIGTSVNSEAENLFGGADVYKSWQSSPRTRTGDYMRPILSNMVGLNYVDINGDGLVDILYNTNNNGIWASYSGIFVNTGEYNFKPVYKCRYNFAIDNLYYGDCADTNFR